MYKHPVEWSKEGGVKLFSVVPADRTRDNGHILKTMKFCLNTRKLFFFNCEVGQTLEQFVQRGYGVPIDGDTQNPTWHIPEQPALAAPALSGALGKGHPEASSNLSNSTIL